MAASSAKALPLAAGGMAAHAIGAPLRRWLASAAANGGS